MERLKIESADIRVSNANDKQREYAISANAHVSGGKVTEVNSGSVAAVPSGVEEYTPDGMPGDSLSTFNTWNGGDLNIQFQTQENRAGILAAVEAFIGQCRECPGIETTAE